MTEDEEPAERFGLIAGAQYDALILEAQLQKMLESADVDLDAVSEALSTVGSLMKNLVLTR